MMSLRLGILGISEGNGHPYSWAAIINGYHPEFMKNCPFPVIPQYLSAQNFPDCRIRKAQVTHVWTQEQELSEQISKAAKIPKVVQNYEQMIGQVDAILLARDDAENHYKMSSPFIKAGLPIYLDKPAALSLKELEKIYALERYPGQVFTCSALRFAKEMQLTSREKELLGPIKKIEATTPKDWEKYALHIIEPVLQTLNPNEKIISYELIKTQPQKTLIASWESGLKTSFTSTGRSDGAISIVFEGTSMRKQLTFSDIFQAFKTSLQYFLDGIILKRDTSNKDFVRKSIEIVEAGCG